MSFTKSFDKYACAGDSICCTIDGFEIRARIVFDDDSHIDDDDSHNVDQQVTGCDDAQHAKLLEARKAWVRNEWFYCGIVLSVSRKGIVLDDHAASLWGIECNYPGTDNSYLLEVANELLTEVLETGRKAMEDLLSDYPVTI